MFCFFSLILERLTHLFFIFNTQRVFDVKREKVSEFARALEETAKTTVTGINIEEAMQALREEDKADKKLYRERLRAKRLEQLRKECGERPAGRRGDEIQRDDEAPKDDFGGDSDDDAVDDQTAAIIAELPDPDRVYASQSEDGEEGEDTSSRLDSIIYLFKMFAYSYRFVTQE